ncbi:hypothetical protein DLR60_11915 [Vibrio tarriae]|uniref:hypothetical protein n=1 Tax=Vibrio tarriae TaxID=2014742 RepID=UPI000DE3C56E|nr:hypothetical protein [Vibrio tarriae]QEO46953.1 hypothetical protein F0315_17255 [Vibrio cholerae]RBM25538.1 hypothetical protein DLR59_14645 [Vibrio tarriae]RBM32604.1 hypothetical protein DLR61_00370 [Vibrio tarriae]RBM35683.1 hypothetical protein DLR58_04920 [Vibrio tarriae]RBM42513.1 hypothetical protein DLR62_04220 [Vibrio tarriae]
MIYSPSPVVAAKNQWLLSQVDVEFPTAESLEGRDIYHALNLQTEVSLFQPQACSVPLLQEIYLVDFHRLTIWFALLQATRSPEKHDQERLVEFFTQIIYSPPCQLFLGFHLGEPVAAGMVTEHEQMVLLSDLVVKPNNLFETREAFAHALYAKWQAMTASQAIPYIEL